MPHKATVAVQAVHRELPLPQAPSWSGYWTFVSAAIIVMFVLYLAQNGSLSTWLSFLSWTTPAPLGTTASAPETPVGSVLGVPGVTTLSPGATGIVTAPGGGEVMNPGQPFDLGAAVKNMLGGH